MLPNILDLMKQSIPGVNAPLGGPTGVSLLSPTAGQSPRAVSPAPSVSGSPPPVPAVGGVGGPFQGPTPRQNPEAFGLATPDDAYWGALSSNIGNIISSGGYGQPRMIDPNQAKQQASMDILNADTAYQQNQIRMMEQQRLQQKMVMEQQAAEQQAEAMETLIQHYPEGSKERAMIAAGQLDAVLAQESDENKLKLQHDLAIRKMDREFGQRRSLAQFEAGLKPAGGRDYNLTQNTITVTSPDGRQWKMNVLTDQRNPGVHFNAATGEQIQFGQGEEITDVESKAARTRQDSAFDLYQMTDKDRQNFDSARQLYDQAKYLADTVEGDERLTVGVWRGVDTVMEAAGGVVSDASRRLSREVFDMGDQQYQAWFNPNKSKAELLENTLTALYAKGQSEDGRVSDADMKRAQGALKTGWSGSRQGYITAVRTMQEQAKRRMDDIERRSEQQATRRRQQATAPYFPGQVSVLEPTASRRGAPAGGGGGAPAVTPADVDEIMNELNVR